MYKLIPAAALSALALWMMPAQAEDTVVAAALAKSAAKLSEDGKLDKAKKICFQSLANDEHCADAIFELGKIMELEGNTVTAGDFYVQSIRLMSKDEATYKAKLLEARNRLGKINPFASQLNNIMSDYVQDLGGIMKKNNDSLTKEETWSLSQNMKFERYVAADKLPKFERGEIVTPPTPPPAVKDVATTKPPEDGPRMRRPSEERAPAANDVPLEVEKALKAPAAGWARITGTWKKKAANIYEVTDGRLEADKTSGGIQCTVHAGGTGSVSLFVRNTKPHRDYENDSDNWATGYGYKVKSRKTILFTPSSGRENGSFTPYNERETPLAASPSNHFMVSILDNRLEYSMNGKREKTATYNLPVEGTFVIMINGTMTIELPQAVGK